MFPLGCLSGFFFGKKKEEVFASPDEAIEHYTRLLQSRHQEFYARAERADCYIMKGMLAEAEEDIGICSGLLGKNTILSTILSFPGCNEYTLRESNIITLRGKIHLAKEEVDEAEACFKKVITFNIVRLDAIIPLSIVYFKKNEFKKMVDLLENADEQVKNISPARFNLGLGYLCMDIYEKAHENFQKAIALNAKEAKRSNDLCGLLSQYDLAQAYGCAGISLERLNKYYEAIPLLEKALELGTDSSDVALSLGIARLRWDRDTDAAQALFYRALDSLPQEYSYLRQKALDELMFTYIAQARGMSHISEEITAFPLSRHSVFKVDPKTASAPKMVIKFFNDRESLLTDQRVKTFYLRHATQHSLNMPKIYYTLDNPDNNFFLYVMQQIAGPELLELMLLNSAEFMPALKEANFQLARMHELSLSGGDELKLEDILSKDSNFFVKRFFEKFLSPYEISLNEKEKEAVLSGLSVINSQLLLSNERAHYEDANLRNWRKGDNVYSFDHEAGIVHRSFVRKVARTLKLPSLIDLINLYEFGSDYLVPDQRDLLLKEYLDERERVGQRAVDRAEFSELHLFAGFFRHRELCGYRKRDSGAERAQWLLDAQRFHLRKSREALSGIILASRPAESERLLRLEELLENKIDVRVLDFCGH